MFLPLAVEVGLYFACYFFFLTMKAKSPEAGSLLGPGVNIPFVVKKCVTLAANQLGSSIC